MKIQAVFFDMGGTIETFNHTHELRLQATADLHKLLLEAGLDLNLEVEQLYTVVTEGLARYHRWRKESLVELPPARVWSEYILADYPVERAHLCELAESLSLFIETRYYQRSMRPEMPAVLEAIQKMGLKLGVISNCQSLGLVPGNLAQYGLKHYFDPIITSSSYGRRKPDPAIFHYAARLAGVPTSHCVYVGDMISRDISGARRAGFSLAIQIRHDAKGDDQAPEGVIPDIVVNDMRELVDILAGELQRSAAHAANGRNSPRRLQALLFDAGDILYFRPHKRRRFHAFLRELGLSQASISDKKASLQTQAFAGQMSRDEYLQALVRLYGVQDPQQVERGALIMEEDESDVQFFDGVEKTLLALKQQGFLLGIITDTAQPVSAKLRWFERAGFGHVWDTIVSSQEVGICKPEPQIYEAALQQLGVLPNETAFVGHEADELDGAKQVNLTTIAFNYEAGVQADFYLVHFCDLLKLPLIA
ncbi:MAG: hypothetical protein BroJett011_72410 [Chloroflexota bacterium]|nr:MAG: hypothetical protein BroJett011_72410 [Chloroflexota bacterium]